MRIIIWKSYPKNRHKKYRKAGLCFVYKTSHQLEKNSFMKLIFLYLLSHSLSNDRMSKTTYFRRAFDKHSIKTLNRIHFPNDNGCPLSSSAPRITGTHKEPPTSRSVPRASRALWKTAVEIPGESDRTQLTHWKPPSACLFAATVIIKRPGDVSQRLLTSGTFLRSTGGRGRVPGKPEARGKALSSTAEERRARWGLPLVNRWNLDEVCISGLSVRVQLNLRKENVLCHKRLPCLQWDIYVHQNQKKKENKIVLYVM